MYVELGPDRTAVRNPRNPHALIPAEGIEVDDHDFLFHQLIAMGDLVVGKSPEQKRIEAEDAQKQAEAEASAEHEVAAGAPPALLDASTEGAH